MPRQRHPAPIGTKHCHGCGQPHSIDAFANDASKSDGLKSQCRACDYARVNRARRAKQVQDAENARKEAARNTRRARDKARRAKRRNPHDQARWAMSQQSPY